MENHKLTSTFVAVLLLSATGCSPSLIPMDKNEMARLKSESKIHVVAYQPPNFNYSTAADGFAAGAIGALTGGLGGAVYGLAMESRASRFAKTYFLEDPVPRAKETFLAGLPEHFDVTRVAQSQEPLSDDGVENLRKNFDNGVVLDFKTESWGLISAPLSSLYQTPYAVRARLVRLADGRVLWQGYCNRDGAGSRATFDEFTANSGALLKKKLGETGEACGKELISQFLGK